MRLAAAIAVVAVAWSAAVYIHQRHHRMAETACSTQNASPYDTTCNGAITTTYLTVRPSWEDPVAILLTIGGVAVAVGILRFAQPS